MNTSPKTPLVSVIMNCRNAAKDLPSAMESVMAQTVQDFEIIFFDNCSTDASIAIAESFGEKVRIVRAASPLSLGMARNQALCHTQGDLIAFLDCDDLWRPTKLERQIACFANESVGLVTTDTRLLHGTREGGRLFAKTRPARGAVFGELLTRQWISMSSAMVRKKALDSIQESPGHWFDERLEVCEEADVFYRIAHDWALDYVESDLTLWRIHGKNTTFERFDAFANETLLIVDKLRKRFPDCQTTYASIFPKLINRASFQKAIALWKNGKAKEARTLVHSLPKTPKTRLFTLCTYLPPSCFTLAARLYFALPRFLRS